MKTPVARQMFSTWEPCHSFRGEGPNITLQPLRSLQEELKCNVFISIELVRAINRIAVERAEWERKEFMKLVSAGEDVCCCIFVSSRDYISAFEIVDVCRRMHMNEINILKADWETKMTVKDSCQPGSSSTSSLMGLPG